MGHEGVLTTYTSYGTVAATRQGEIMSALANGGPKSPLLDAEKVADAVLRRMFEQRLLCNTQQP